MSAPARRRPKPHDAETFAGALYCLGKADVLSEHEISFIRAMAAIAMSGSPTPEQAARLMDIARRVGAEP
jgi:hypothetical protein